MQYDEFMNQVKEQARVASTGEAVRATRATLEALGQRLNKEEAHHLAAQLPSEIGYYLGKVERHSERFDLDEFYDRVAEYEGKGVDKPEAIHHARSVLAVVSKAVTPGELNDVRAQLPDEFHPLFEGETQ
jgi:uncharacterized protein (DUF2267 family)